MSESSGVVLIHKLTFVFLICQRTYLNSFPSSQVVSCCHLVLRATSRGGFKFTVNSENSFTRTYLNEETRMSVTILL